MSQVSRGQRASWLDDLPAGWEVLEPRRIFALRREAEQPDDGHLTPSQKYGVLPQKQYMEITGNRVVQNLSGTKMQHVEPGDFIIHLRTFQGGLELSRTPGKVSPAYTVVTPRESVNPEYYKYALKSQGYISQISSVTDQLRDGQSMRYGEFNLTPLPAPPPTEQQAIADYHDHETADIDALIHNLAYFRDLLIESLRSRRYQLFTPTEDSDKLRIKQVAKIGNGSGFPPALQGNPSQEIPFYKVGSLRHSRNGSLVDSPDSISRETARQIGATIFPPHTIAMAKIGAALLLNRHAMTTRASCLDNNLMGLIPNHLVNPGFLMHELANIDLGPMTNPGAVPSLNVNWYRNVEVWVPSRGHQETVLREYEAHRILIEATVEDISESARLARERRAALITAAVTGQIDLTARNKPAAEQLEDDIAQGLHREN